MDDYDKVSQRILNSIETAFGVELEGKSLAECTPGAIDGWDSLSFLNLILALEEEFSISIDADHIADMTEGGLKILEVINEEIQKRERL